MKKTKAPPYISIQFMNEEPLPKGLFWNDGMITLDINIP